MKRERGLEGEEKRETLCDEKGEVVQRERKRGNPFVMKIESEFKERGKEGILSDEKREGVQRERKRGNFV